MKSGIDVLCIGIAVADVMGKVIDEVPSWGHLGTFDHLEYHPGGCAVNTAIDLARLGAGTAVCACVGRDGSGMFVRRRLEEEGVDVSALVETVGAVTSYTFIMISSDGRRRYLHHVGANAQFTAGDVPDEMIRRAKILHLAGSCLMPSMDGEPSVELLRRARQLGAVTCMDTAYNPLIDSRAVIEPCLAHLDIFFPSIEEAQAITDLDDPGSMLDWLSRFRIPILGIKLGEQGCILRSGDQTWRLPAFDVPVVDTSGAGDAFMAGFLYGRLKDWDLQRCALFGNAVSARCIQAIGCSAGVVSADEVLTFMSLQGCAAIKSTAG